MSEIDMICAQTFLEQQGKLFPKPVADNAEEAREFLEDCFAQVFENVADLKKYLKEEGVDTSDYDEITEALEVFELPDGRFIYVEA